MVCYPNQNNGNNDEQYCVNVFPTDEKTPYEQGELVVARLIVHNFLKRSPAWTKPERVLMSLL